MDITQVFIIISLSAISIAICLCTYYLITLIKELIKVTAEVTNILDDAHEITGSIAKPVASFSEFVMGFKNGFQLFNNFFDKKEK